jgi:hypothetical protein
VGAALLLVRGASLFHSAVCWTVAPMPTGRTCFRNQVPRARKGHDTLPWVLKALSLPQCSIHVPLHSPPQLR